MSYNSFGHRFRMTTWGESHGVAIGVVLDGVPSGLELSESLIDSYLARRKVGQSKITSQRKESDRCKILSGLFEGKTTGTPISIMIENEDARSSDYSELEDIYRPSHADYTYDSKYNIRDHKGGGRSSARETAARVAAGAIADTFLKKLGIKIYGHVVQVGDIVADEFDIDQIDKNLVRCADKKKAILMEELILKARDSEDSVGGIVEVVAVNVKAGLGAPVYRRLDAEIANALISINAVKGVEIGSGFKLGSMYASQANDQIRIAADRSLRFLSNNSGGIDGGISNGNPIVARMVVKPTPSISRLQHTVDKNHKEKDIRIKGRHDPCVAPRAVSVAEAMLAMVLADHMILDKGSRLGDFL